MSWDDSVKWMVKHIGPQWASASAPGHARAMLEARSTTYHHMRPLALQMPLQHAGEQLQMLLHRVASLQRKQLMELERQREVWELLLSSPGTGMVVVIIASGNQSHAMYIYIYINRMPSVDQACLIQVLTDARSLCNTSMQSQTAGAG